MGNREVIGAIYEAFGRGDVPFILGQMREDVEWEHDTVDRGIPWILPGRGVADVGRFFAAAVAELEMRDFSVLGMLEGKDTVAVVARVHWIVKRTGRELRDYEVHLWTLDAEGRVARMKHLIDTAGHLAALGRLDAKG
jgi:ketosteroid isomerase-like protein